MKNGYIFLCSNKTQDECLERFLFGGGSDYRKVVPHVSPGDVLCLYNMISRRLYGFYEATSESAMNIVLEAWEGRFPWQVRIRPMAFIYPALSRDDIEDFIPFNLAKPRAVLTPAQLVELEKRFGLAKRRSEKEHDFRDETKTLIRTDDSHQVQSYGEEAIDNWLFEQGIAHAYEVSVVVDKEVMSCDFVIRTRGKKNIYVEFWEMNTPSYIRNRAYKESLYKKSGLDLIGLERKDLDKLGIALKRVLEED